MNYIYAIIAIACLLAYGWQLALLVFLAPVLFSFLKDLHHHFNNTRYS